MSTKYQTAGIGDICIGQSPEMIRVVALGSCIAIAIYDPQLKLGGLSHSILPYESNAQNRPLRPGKFADCAIKTLIKKLVQRGAARTQLIAKLAGGAKMFENLNTANIHIGANNVQSARKALKEANIPIMAADVGKNFSRTVIFEHSTGKLITTRAGGKHRREL